MTAEQEIDEALEALSKQVEEEVDTGYETNFEQLSATEGAKFSRVVRDVIESGMVEFLIKKFGMPSEIKNKDGVITMDDFSHIAELGYLPHHTIHVSKKGIKITYLMYKLEGETLEKEITISTRVGFAE